MNEDKITLSSDEKAVISETSESATRANQLTWIVWWGGTALVVASWFGMVGNTVGWIGFALALASSFISVMVKKYWRFPK